MKRKTNYLLKAAALLSTFSLVGLISSCGLRTDWFEKELCKHNFESEIVKEATCMEYGELLKTCVFCDVEETEQIEKLPHTEEKIEYVAATCLTAGRKAGKKCSTCDTVLEGGEVIPAFGHKLVTIPGIAAGCFTEGFSEGKQCQTCKTWFTQQMVIQPTGHVDANTDGICDQCEELLNFEEYFYARAKSAQGTLSEMKADAPLKAYEVYRFAHDFSKGTGAVTELVFLDTEYALHSQIAFFSTTQQMTVRDPITNEVILLPVLYYVAPDLSYIDFCFLTDETFYEDKLHFLYNDGTETRMIETRIALNMENLYEVHYEENLA